MTEKKARLSRRNFLVTLGAGGAAATATVITTKNAKPTAQTASQDKRATVGYQADSEHVNNYYRTTKV